MLDQYGNERYHKEPDRVKLAMLKPSGGNQAKPQKYVQAASEDYRDVLAWDEYPNQMRTSPRDAEAFKRAKEVMLALLLVAAGVLLFAGTSSVSPATAPVVVPVEMEEGAEVLGDSEEIEASEPAY